MYVKYTESNTLIGKEWMGVRMGVLDAADLQPGQRVLDVGCGHGDITLLAARSVGPRGLALGVDASVPLIERARQRACEAGLANVGFLCADARTHRFAPLRFDVIISQIGLTRRAPDDAGFANLARALRRGGRLVFVSFTNPNASTPNSGAPDSLNRSRRARKRRARRPGLSPRARSYSGR